MAVDIENISTAKKARSAPIVPVLPVGPVSTIEGGIGDYDGVKNSLKRTGGGRRGIEGDRSADAELTERTLKILRADAKRLARNNVILRGIIERAADLGVGSGLIPQARTEDEAWNTAAEEAFAAWAANSADHAGIFAFDEIQRLTWRDALSDGDKLVIRVLDGAGLFTLQIIDAAQIVTPFALSEIPAGSTVVAGVRRSIAGRVEGFYVAPYAHGLPDPSRCTFVPAEHAMHVAFRRTSGQSRGEPAASALSGLVEIVSRYLVATAVASEVAACQTLIFKTENPADKQATLLGETITREDGSSQRTMELTPGMVHFTEQNGDVTSFNPNQPNEQAEPFIRTVMRLISSDQGMPLELGALDFSASSAYAGRTGVQVYLRGLEPRRKVFISQFLAPTWRFFIDCAVEAGILPDRPDRHAHTWIAPPPLVFEPDKEIKATLDALNGNLTTQKTELERRGLDYRATMRQRRAERKLEREYGIEPVNAPGAKTASQGSGENPSTNGADDVTT
jgi:lambda family phage portal protein